MRHRSMSRFFPQLFWLLALAASLAGSCGKAFSAAATVTWDAVPRIEVRGYKIYYQGASKSEVSSIDVGNVTNYKVSGLSPNTYYFCVTAYDRSGREAPCSESVSISIPRPMYGDGGASPEPKDAFQAGLYQVTSARTTDPFISCGKYFLVSGFHPVGWLDTRIVTRPQT